jgi:hypothetical protein
MSPGTAGQAAAQEYFTNVLQVCQQRLGKNKFTLDSLTAGPLLWAKRNKQEG